MLSKIRFNALDIETTSLDKNAEILSIAIVPMLGTRILIRDCYSTFIKSKRINAKSIKIHGIDIKTIESAPRFEEVSEIIFKKLENGVVVGCDIEFDVSILKKYFSNQDLKFDPMRIDILQIERYIRRKTAGRNINTFDELIRIYRLDDFYRHSALVDAYYSAQIFQLQLKRLMLHGISLEELLRIGKRREDFIPFYMG